MTGRIKNALPRSLLLSAVITLIGLPLGRYHVEKMAMEMLRYFVIAFIVFLVLNVLFDWLSELRRQGKH